MSYSEVDGKVVLTMSTKDYSDLLLLLGIAGGYARTQPDYTQTKWVDFMNRLNEGNPHYSPYREIPTHCSDFQSGRRSEGEQ